MAHRPPAAEAQGRCAGPGSCGVHRNPSLPVPRPLGSVSTGPQPKGPCGLAEGAPLQRGLREVPVPAHRTPVQAAGEDDLGAQPPSVLAFLVTPKTATSRLGNAPSSCRVLEGQTWEDLLSSPHRGTGTAQLCRPHRAGRLCPWRVRGPRARRTDTSSRRTHTVTTRLSPPASPFPTCSLRAKTLLRGIHS